MTAELVLPGLTAVFALVFSLALFDQWRERRGDARSDVLRERDRRDDRNEWRDRQGVDRRGDNIPRRDLQQREPRGPGAGPGQRDDRVRAERNRGESGSTGRIPDQGPPGRLQQERM